MKTYVRTHLRRKRHGKSIVRSHKRIIKGRRRMWPFTKKHNPNEYDDDDDDISISEAISLINALSRLYQ